MMRIRSPHLWVAMIACVCSLSWTSVSAVDLTVASLEVAQAGQFGTTKLFGDNVTWVRAKISINGALLPVQNVDAVLWMYVDGSPFPASGAPVSSLNGPIGAPVTPLFGNLNDTLNFAVIPPASNDVDFVLQVNPSGSVNETSYDNNFFVSQNNVFECRRVIEVAYVSINYTYNGAGLPSPTLIEPGIGDGFLRAVYHPSEWNYHRAPMPPLNWTQDINTTGSQLLNTLRDIRLNQLPAAGYPQPDFVYGWLPGNPYEGNGQAISMPGDVAFGNTDTTRHQRTFAHEMGHCFGLAHNNVTTNALGIDVERHLKNTQDLAQLFPATKSDIMMPGQLTTQAFIGKDTYNAVHADPRMQCSPLAGEAQMEPVLRVCGIIEQSTRAITLDPVMRIALGQPTQSQPHGDLRIVGFDDAGKVLTQVTVQTDTARELCVAHDPNEPILASTTPFYVLLPETVGEKLVHHIQILDTHNSKLIGTRQRSIHAPQSSVLALQSVDAAPIDNPKFNHAGKALAGRVRLTWAASDADGDSLVHNLLYSPDGGMGWLPLAVNVTGTFFDFDTRDVPRSRGPGLIKLVTSDGMNTTESEPMETALASANPPETYLMTPNHGDTFPQNAPIVLHAASWDLEDLMLSGYQIEWTSNVDGFLGHGQLLIYSQLSPFGHTITVTGTDKDGQSSSKSIDLFIVPRSGGPSCPPDLTADGNINVDDLLAVVNSWGLCPGCMADITNNGFVDFDDFLDVINGWGSCP